MNLREVVRRGGTTILAVLLSAPSLRAFYGDSAEVVDYNRLRAGVLLTVPTRPGIAGLVTAGAGVNDWASVHIQLGGGVGLRSTNAAFRAAAEFKALVSELFGGTDLVSVYAGPVWERDIGLRLGTVLSTRWKWLHFNTGVDAAFWFTGARPRASAHFLIGAKVWQKLDFLKLTRMVPAGVAELAVPMTPKADYRFTLGLLYNLDYKIW